ncbi:hypothetical protein RND71_029750 [Anisodus tanguticus]|uniref:Uncharacterized protein n=1 Tax=Anisodus tanguticus TaxID=243964 RepID=A0AAE1V0G9_9SOLA|nr:hypothetical protein RND71_029750 [Anisodus tanguticus]
MDIIDGDETDEKKSEIHVWIFEISIYGDSVWLSQISVGRVIEDFERVGDKEINVVVNKPSLRDAFMF